jgi:hypothetical protein
MDNRYRSIYGAIYLSRTLPPEDAGRLGAAGLWQWDYPRRVTPDTDAMDRLGQAIDGADRPGRRLREDAKALLAVNFSDLVITPLTVGSQISTGELSEDVDADIAMLAAEAKVEPETGEVSGHAVIDALSNNWSNLRVGRFRLWEQSFD